MLDDAAVSYHLVLTKARQGQADRARIALETTMVEAREAPRRAPVHLHDLERNR